MIRRKAIGFFSVFPAIFFLITAVPCTFCQAYARSFGFPAAGFVDNFEDSSLSDMTQKGFFITSHSVAGSRSLECDSTGMAYYPNAYLRGIHDSVAAGWRRISQGAISAVIISDSVLALEGVGFISDSGAAVFALLKAGFNRVDILQRWVRNGIKVDSLIKEVQINMLTGNRYKLEFLWSPYANAGIANLYSVKGNVWGLDTSLVGLAISPTSLHPVLFCSGGAARFDSVAFDPNLDNWNYDWEFYEQIALFPAKIASLASNTNFANGVHWKWKNDGKFYMHMRNGTTYSATNVLNWTKVGVSPVWTVSDPCILIDPFGDGYVYKSARNMAWYRSNGSDGFVTWDSVGTLGKNTSGLTGAMQDVIDVKKYPGRLDSISFGGKKYRFIGMGEQTFDPYSTVVLSNDLHTWVRPDTMPIPTRSYGGWQEQGDAIGCGFPMADGNILIISCSCTNSGYTGGGYEATGVSAVLNGKQPWVTQKVSKLPMTPATPTGWTIGPNMPNSFVWDSTGDVLYFFSNFHDSAQGVMRVRNFSAQTVGLNGHSTGMALQPQRLSVVFHKDQISIILPDAENSGTVDLSIIDVRGRTMCFRHAGQAATAVFSTATLPNGLYVLSVRCSGRETMRKTIVIAR